MKKYFFLSIVAVGAMFASCSKSEIVDSKFGNDEIGFQTYTGRDAQTKAPVTTSLTKVGLYGFYTGNAVWGTSSAANLWDNDPLTYADGKWNTTGTKYWANAADYYTFLAYAPYSEDNTNLTASEGADPTLTYTVVEDLEDQIDLVYANTPYDVDTKAGHINMVKPADDAPVNLVFKHALSRLTVKATGPDTGDFTFHIKEVSISGKFNTVGEFNIHNGVWTPTTNEDAEYVFYTGPETITSDEAAAADKLVSVDYSGTTYGEDGKVEAYGNNYLMMIPTNFSATDATAAKLYVKYTTYYMGQESKPIEKTFDVVTDFQQGKAYTINLAFSIDADPITFDVTVSGWDENTTSQDEEIEG